MAKGTIQDIIVNKKKTPGTALPNKLSFPPAGGSSLPPFERSYGEEPPTSRKRFYALSLVAVAAFAVLLFTLSIFFVSATVTVYPKNKVVSINKTVEANKTSGSDLVFDVVSLSADVSMTMPATGIKEVRKKASGSIIVYNAHGPKSQKLIKNTRFESTDGKIYRIDSSITVPGSSEVSGKIVPGSVEAAVFADEPGDKYNIGKTDFTIPGFKGDPRYSKFYARSKTDMEGGVIGSVTTLSETDLITSNATLKKRLTETLLNDIRKNIPQDFIFYDNLFFIEEGETKTLGKEGDKEVSVERSGKIYAIIMRKSLLSKFIAKSEIPDYDNSPVSSHALSNLSMSIKNKELIEPSDINSLTLSIVGATTIVWDFDKDLLLNNLHGKPKKNFHAILAEFPNIVKAELSTTPFWARVLPEKLSEITVKTILE